MSCHIFAENCECRCSAGQFGQTVRAAPTWGGAGPGGGGRGWLSPRAAARRVRRRRWGRAAHRTGTGGHGRCRGWSAPLRSASNCAVVHRLPVVFAGNRDLGTAFGGSARDAAPSLGWVRLPGRASGAGVRRAPRAGSGRVCVGRVSAPEVCRTRCRGTGAERMTSAMDAAAVIHSIWQICVARACRAGRRARLFVVGGSS